MQIVHSSYFIGKGRQFMEMSGKKTEWLDLRRNVPRKEKKKSFFKNTSSFRFL